MGDIVAESQRIAREHEVKLLIGEIIAAWEQAEGLRAIDRQSPLCRGADCLPGGALRKLVRR